MMTPVEQMRNPAATLQALLEAIETLAPDSAQWWSFTVSHGRFLLRLYRSGAADDLIVAAIGASHIAGPTHWPTPALRFTINPENGSGTPQSPWLIADDNCGFTVHCSNLYWGMNVDWYNPESWFATGAHPGVA